MKRFALACCLVLLPGAAFADGDFRYELTPHVSHHFSGSLHTEGAFFDGDFQIEDDVAYGLTFDIPLSNNLQLELLYNYQESDLFFDGGIFGPDIELLETEIAYAHIGLLAQFGRPSVTPYFVVSAGLTRFDPQEIQGAGADNRFSVSLGAGVKLFFTDHIGLRFEGRGFWTEMDGLDGGCDQDECIRFHDYFSQGEATLGLIFAW